MSNGIPSPATLGKFNSFANAERDNPKTPLQTLESRAHDVTECKQAAQTD